MITGQGLLGSVLPTGLALEAGADAGTARRLAVKVAHAQGFAAAQEARVALVATELATNLTKYARAGRLLVRLIEWGDLRGVELLALDKGPGMRDAASRMRDGFSTGGTLGAGLGAINRLSDLFDLYSLPGQGTVVMARFWGAPLPQGAHRPFDVGAVAEALPGEFVSGDAWAVEQRGNRAVVLVADGLGHGPVAAEASVAAVLAFRCHHREPVDAIVSEIHRALHRTRGAAVAVAEVDRDTRRVRFCGVGNISARLHSARPASLMSHFGIAGHQAARIQAVEAPWEDGAALVMHSDGVSTKWSLDGYPGVLSHHPLLLAAALIRDADRGRDDATVLVLRDAWSASGGS